jgi:hypothetical protein
LSLFTGFPGLTSFTLSSLSRTSPKVNFCGASRFSCLPSKAKLLRHACDFGRYDDVQCNISYSLLTETEDPCRSKYMHNTLLLFGQTGCSTQGNHVYTIAQQHEGQTSYQYMHHRYLHPSIALAVLQLRAQGTHQIPFLEILALG